jgi:YfiH family protein
MTVTTASTVGIQWLDWPAPAQVNACYTVRAGGVSLAPYDSLNMGDHVGDQEMHVMANRQYVQALTEQPHTTWLKQVHGIEVVEASSTYVSAIEADACFSQQAGHVCAVMTADCLPVFFCDTQGNQVAVAHAGWRGLLDGVLQQTIRTFDSNALLMAYLGPAISQCAFEVGAEVRDAFITMDITLQPYFIPAQKSDKWMADLYGIARIILTNMGVTAIYGGTRCTYTEENMFFSYRRDGITGRMANLIWIE